MNHKLKQYIIIVISFNSNEEKNIQRSA